VDIFGIVAQAGIATQVNKHLIITAAMEVLFTNGELSYDGANFVNGILSGDVTVQSISSVSNDLIDAIRGFSLWDKAMISIGVGLNWFGDIWSDGTLIEAGNLLSVATIAVDAGQLAYQIGYSYGQYVRAYYGTHSSGTTWFVTSVGAYNTRTGQWIS
jgi:hypothetical protein